MINFQLICDVDTTTISYLQEIAVMEKKYFKSPWTVEMLASSLCSSAVIVIATDDECDDKLVGYGGFYTTGDITNIAVSAEYRGRGLGKSIVDLMIDNAKTLSVDTLFLEVRVGNTIAINLYDKCGFKHIHNRKRYYEDGEDAMIFSREV